MDARPTNSLLDTDAIRALIDAGGHLFAVGPDKRPFRDGWQTEPDEDADVLQHVGRGGRAGLIPTSVGLCVVDIDIKAGDGGPPIKNREQAVVDAIGEPLAFHDTPSGGLHYWYREPEGGAGNAKWCWGDIRCSKGYVVLWRPDTALRAVHEAGAAEPVDLSKLPQKAGKADGNKAGITSKLKASTPADLTETAQGDRNNTLNAGVYADARAGRLSDAREVEWTDAALAAGLAAGEVAETIASAKTGAASKTRTAPALAAGLAAEFPSKLSAQSPEGIARVLAAIGIEHRYDIRADKMEWRPCGEGEWQERTDRALADWYLGEIPRCCAVVEIDPEAKRAPKRYPLALSKNQIVEALNGHGFHHTVDPFVEYLQTRPAWDGTPRNWLAGCFPSLDGDPLAEWASRSITLSCVRRAFKPGAKLDTVNVIQGTKQGTGKSWALSHLFPRERREQWFDDSLSFRRPKKEIIEGLQGRVLVEFAEMDGANRAEVERLKAFITTRNDGAQRMAYRTDPENRPRRCAFTGTSNACDMLPNDPTGNRRFVVHPTQETDPDHIKHVNAYQEANRDQLWAEALHRYEGGEAHHLTARLADMAAARNETFRNANEGAEGLVSKYLETLPPGALVDFTEVQRWLENQARTPPRSGEIEQALKNLGYDRRKRRWPQLGGRECRRWFLAGGGCLTTLPPESLPETAVSGPPATPATPLSNDVQKNTPKVINTPSWNGVSQVSQVSQAARREVEPLTPPTSGPVVVHTPMPALMPDGSVDPAFEWLRTATTWEDMHAATDRMQATQATAWRRVRGES